MSDILTIILFILSLIAGSFLTVIITRIPLKKNFVMGRSKCPNCDHTIGVIYLVPFVSWILLGGRCRYCQQKISLLYPIIEWGALGVFIWSYMTLPHDFLWASCLLGWFLLTLSAIDIRHHLLPDGLNFILLAVGLGFNFLYFPESMIDVLAGTIIGYVLFGAISWAYHRIRHVDGLGLGDAKLLAAAGAWVGWQGLTSVILISSVSGLIIATLWIIISKKEPYTYKIPFGPFLASGIWLTWLYGPIV